MISFEGSCDGSMVSYVRVENINKGTSITISGAHVLHLKADIISGQTDYKNYRGKIRFSPNPMTDNTLMRFVTLEQGLAEISLFDYSGKMLSHKEEYLLKGLHTYRIKGLMKEGFYFVRIRCGQYECSGILVCPGSQNNQIEIIYESTLSVRYTPDCTVVDMQYSYGDRLKFTGFAGNCNTVIYDVPDANKTISFIFSPCTDADGNNYPVVQIGSQLWMAENLKTTSYRNNTPIPNVTDGAEWAGLTTPAYCWYNNNIKNKDIYGALYNWYVVNTGKLCPDGWHVPTDDEWHEMVLYLDQDAVQDVEESNIAGGKLKEEGILHWSEPNTGATDEVGFTARAGGVRKYDGVFSGPTGHGNWRTSSEYDDTQVWYRYIFYYSASIYRKPTNKQAGYSVRCISDL